MYFRINNSIFLECRNKVLQKFESFYYTLRVLIYSFNSILIHKRIWYIWYPITNLLLWLWNLYCSSILMRQLLILANKLIVQLDWRISYLVKLNLVKLNLGNSTILVLGNSTILNLRYNILCFRNCISLSGSYRSWLLNSQ